MKPGVEEIRPLREPRREAGLLQCRVAVCAWTRTDDGWVVAIDQPIVAGSSMPRRTCCSARASEDGAPLSWRPHSIIY